MALSAGQLQERMGFKSRGGFNQLISGMRDMGLLEISGSHPRRITRKQP